MSSSPIVNLVSKAGPQGLETGDLCRHYKCTPQEIGDEIERLKEAGEIIGFAGVWVVPEVLPQLEGQVIDALAELHRANPTEPLFAPEDVAKQAGLLWGTKPVSRLLDRVAEGGGVRGRNNRYGLAKQPIEMKTATRVLLDRVKAELDRGDIGAATTTTMARDLHLPPQALDEILDIGANNGEVRELTPGFWITAERLAGAKEQIKAEFGDDSPTVAQVRDHLATSRRIAHAILEAEG